MLGLGLSLRLCKNIIKKWILKTGFWNDNGIWDDNAEWED